MKIVKKSHLSKAHSFLLFFFMFVFVSLPGISITKNLAQTATASEAITSFNSQITINQDTSVTITENIQYTTTLNKHGIYRYVPQTYSRGGLKHNREITGVSVTNEQSQPIQYQLIQDGQFLTLKIGDPDQTFTGDQTYLITYTMSQAIDRWDTTATDAQNPYHELYWDITGEGWNVPIASSTATVVSPHATITDATCFTGPIGGDDGKCQTSLDQTQNQATFTYPHTIGYNDNMTVAVMLNPENELLFPASTTTLMQLIRHNFPLAALPIPFLAIFLLWYTRGRDYAFSTSNAYNLDPSQPQRTIWPSLRAREPFVYAPIKELTPGQAGLLINEKVDTRDLVAEILELARKKYMKIESVTSKKFLGLGTNTDYRFTKLKNNINTNKKNAATKQNTSADKLPEVQQYLLNQIFATKDSILVSELKGTFYTHMAAASKKLEKSSLDFFTAKPSNARPLGIAVFAIAWSGTFLLIAATFFAYNIFWPLPFLLIQLPVGIFLGYHMPQKTAVGHALWLQTRGLRKSIRYGKWREKIKEKNLFIEEVLPFAVSLGVVGQLSKDMEKLNIQPPDYLGASAGASPNAALAAMNTTAFVNSFSSSVGSNLSYNPNASSSGSGSGFSGGSSGGGGGGGGGGSW